MCGDFFQLPPVGDDESEGVRYCFEADCWSQVVPHCYELKQIWRQSDQVFVSMLNEVRKGQISNETLERLMQCRNTQFDESDGIKATMLCKYLVPYR
jgi:ATP-dependent DNA helicase PIF1